MSALDTRDADVPNADVLDAEEPTAKPTRTKTAKEPKARRRVGPVLVVAGSGIAIAASEVYGAYGTPGLAAAAIATAGATGGALWLHLRRRPRRRRRGRARSGASGWRSTRSTRASGGGRARTPAGGGRSRAAAGGRSATSGNRSARGTARTSRATRATAARRAGVAGRAVAGRRAAATARPVPALSRSGARRAGTSRSARRSSAAARHTSGRALAAAGGRRRASRGGTAGVWGATGGPSNPRTRRRGGRHAATGSGGGPGRGPGRGRGPLGALGARMRRTRGGRRTLAAGRAAGWTAALPWRTANAISMGRLNRAVRRRWDHARQSRWGRRQRERGLDWAWLARQSANAWQADLGDCVARCLAWVGERVTGLRRHLDVEDMSPFQRDSLGILLKVLIWLTKPLEKLGWLFDPDHQPDDPDTDETDTPPLDDTESDPMSDVVADQRLLDLGEEIRAILTEDGDGAATVVQRLKGLQELLGAVATGMGGFAESVAEEFPTTPCMDDVEYVTQALRSSEDAVADAVREFATFHLEVE